MKGVIFLLFMLTVLPAFAEDSKSYPNDDLKSYSYKADEMNRRIDELSIRLSEQQDQLGRIKRQAEIYNEIQINIAGKQSKDDECRREMGLLIELENLSANDQDRADMSDLKIKHNARCPEYRF